MFATASGECQASCRLDRHAAADLRVASEIVALSGRPRANGVEIFDGIHGAIADERATTPGPSQPVEVTNTAAQAIPMMSVGTSDVNVTNTVSVTAASSLPVTVTTVTLTNPVTEVTVANPVTSVTAQQGGAPWSVTGNVGVSGVVSAAQSGSWNVVVSNLPAREPYQVSRIRTHPIRSRSSSR